MLNLAMPVGVIFIIVTNQATENLIQIKETN